MKLGYRIPAKKVTSYGLNGGGFHSWQGQRFFSSSPNPEEEAQRWHNLEFCADILSTEIITPNTYVPSLLARHSTTLSIAETIQDG